MSCLEISSLWESIYILICPISHTQLRLYIIWMNGSKDSILLTVESSTIARRLPPTENEFLLPQQNTLFPAESFLHWIKAPWFAEWHSWLQLQTNYVHIIITVHIMFPGLTHTKNIFALQSTLANRNKWYKKIGVIHLIGNEIIFPLVLSKFFAQNSFKLSTRFHGIHLDAEWDLGSNLSLLRQKKNYY